MFYYRERSGRGNYVLVAQELGVVVDASTDTVLRTFPPSKTPKDYLEVMRGAVVYSCLCDLANGSVRVTRFSSGSRTGVEPVSLSAFSRKEREWMRNPRYRFRFVIQLPKRIGRYKQVVYVMEEK